MKEHILQVLRQIELDYDVKILYACESGSRALGLHSEDSDFDVRFIYIPKPDWYLSIDQKRDVLEIPKKDKLSIPVDPLLDVSGWELTKALRLFRKSNPTLLEWLNSTIIYYQAYSTVGKMIEMTNRIFSPVVCLHHYLHMAKGDFRDATRGDEPKIKKYFNALRSIFAAKWIEKHLSAPPVDLQKLMEEFIEPGELKDVFDGLVNKKRARERFMPEPALEVLNRYFIKEMERLETYLGGLKTKNSDPTSSLDRLFRDTLKEVWNLDVKSD